MRAEAQERDARRGDVPTAGETAEQQIRALFAVAEALNDPDNRDLRRSPRHAVNVPVWIYGHGPDGTPFHAEARAVNVSMTGALLLVNSSLSCGDEILISDKKKSKQLVATVVRFGISREGLEEVGVSFHISDKASWRPGNIQRAAEPANTKNASAKKRKTWKRKGAR
jgi:hypothetical protein